MWSTKQDEKGFLTEAVLIESLKKQRNDPKLKASMEDVCRGFFDAMDTNEDGYVDMMNSAGHLTSLAHLTRASQSTVLTQLIPIMTES